MFVLCLLLLFVCSCVRLSVRVFVRWLLRFFIGLFVHSSFSVFLFFFVSPVLPFISSCLPSPFLLLSWSFPSSLDCLLLCSRFLSVRYRSFVVCLSCHGFHPCLLSCLFCSSWLPCCSLSCSSWLCSWIISNQFWFPFFAFGDHFE